MSVRADHSAKNAIRNLYAKKYELDKDFSFKVPRLKLDLEAYLHRILSAVDAAFDEANVTKYKGHELRWPKRGEEETEDIKIK